MGAVVAAWFGLLLGLTGIGVVTALIVNFLSNARSGLR